MINWLDRERVMEIPEAEALPFKPYIFLKGDRDKIDIFVDPRITFKNTGKNLFIERAGSHMPMVLSESHMMEVALDLSQMVQSIYYRGEIEIVNYPLPDEPLWEHDCSKCVFLGTSREHDLYYCPGGFTSTLIARYGSRHSQYKSGIPLIKYDVDIWNAAVLAQERGLINLLDDQRYMLVIDDEIRRNDFT